MAAEEERTGEGDVDSRIRVEGWRKHRTELKMERNGL